MQGMVNPVYSKTPLACSNTETLCRSIVTMTATKKEATILHTVRIIFLEAILDLIYSNSPLVILYTDKVRENKSKYVYDIFQCI